MELLFHIPIPDQTGTWIIYVFARARSRRNRKKQKLKPLPRVQEPVPDTAEDARTGWGRGYRWAPPSRSQTPSKAPTPPKERKNENGAEDVIAGASIGTILRQLV